jgi:hypothetical protein
MLTTPDYQNAQVNPISISLNKPVDGSAQIQLTADAGLWLGDNKEPGLKPADKTALTHRPHTRAWVLPRFRLCSGWLEGIGRGRFS